MDYINFDLVPTDPRRSLRLLDFYTLVSEHNSFIATEPKNTWLYFIDWGSFHKIGITRRSIEDRFKNYKNRYRILDKLKLAEKDARYLEKRLLSLVDGPFDFRTLKNPHEMVKLGGYTECFYPGPARTFKELIPDWKKPSRKKNRSKVHSKIAEIYDELNTVEPSLEEKVGLPEIPW